METQVLHKEDDYVEAEKLLLSKNVYSSALRKDKSKTFIVKTENGLVGLATLSDYKGFPLLQHFIVKSNNISSGRILLNLIHSVESEVKNMGFHSFYIDTCIKRHDALKAIQKYFKNRILKTKDVDSSVGIKRLFMVRA